MLPDHSTLNLLAIHPVVAGIEQTVHEGEPIKRADEIGYFKFGGSTIIMLFEPGKVVFDADILKNSDQAIETLVRILFGNYDYN